MASIKKETRATTNSTENPLFYDIWDDALPKVQTNLSPELEDYYLKHVKKRQPKKFVPKTPSQKSVIRAVEAPHPGSSYNPALDDHLVLLMEAGKTERAKLKRERRLERALKKPAAEDLVTPEIKLKESREGLEPVKSEDEDDELEPGKESYRPAVPVISAENRKLSAVRKRQKLRKLQEKEKRKEKLARIRQSEIYRLRSIKKDIKRQDEDQSEKKERKRRRRERLAKTKPPKLSSIPYEAADMELQLSNELRGSLLELKPEGNLLEDRYKSLQKRGVVEPRVMQSHKRKHKRKTYERRSHRDMPEGYLPR